MADKAQVIRELTADDARILPEPVRAAVLQTATPAPEVALVQELRGALGVDDKADLTQLVTELQASKVAQAQAAVKARITELVNDQEKGVKVAAVRPLVTELVAARNPQTPADADAAYAAVVEMQAVKDALAATVQGTMGPRQRTPVAAQKTNDKGGGFFIYPQEEGA